jgi:cell division protein FtsB
MTHNAYAGDYGAKINSGYQGYARDAGKYKERAEQQKRTFPNRRRKIITGKDLTTPLGRIRTSEAQKEKYRQAVRGSKIQVRQNVIPVSRTHKKRLPLNAIFCVAIISVFLLGLICTHIVLHEKDIDIAKMNAAIAYEERREQRLERELDVKNNLGYILERAVRELGMVKEDLIPRYYLSVSPEDKAVIIGERSGPVIDFSNILSPFLNNGR